MRRWQAIPVAAVAALLTGVALFASAPLVTTYAAPSAAAPPTDQYYIALDCGSGPGVDCDIPVPASGALDVAVKFGNPVAMGGAKNLAAFNFDVYNPNAAQLGVGVGVPTRNAAFTGLTSCASPAADDDTGLYGAGATDSFLSCLDPSGAGDTFASGSVTTLGTVHYNVNAVSGGSAALVLFSVSAVDPDGVPVVTCDPTNSPPDAPIVPDPGTAAGECANVTINFTGAPTATPTATATPVTVVPTNTPIVGTPTSLAYVTVTPTGSPTVPATDTPSAGTTPAATAPTGGGTGTTPGGGSGAGGAGPIRLPDTGSGSERGIDWTFAAVAALLALGAGGVAGGLYFGAASVAQGRRSRREG
ncbi:MAG: hypothetical protein HY874_11745 [Chloroflexi bacterium]|nr:hypothetical protein [Chloroflexota bacterium]